MDSFNFTSVKSQKAAAMRRYNLFAGITRTLRILELCLVLVLLCWILLRLPFALRFSAHYFLKFSAFLGSPLFVFIISNAIIATLVAKSGRFSDASSHADTEIYEEFLKNSADRAGSPSEADAQLCVAEGEVAYQDKEIVSEMNTTDRTLQDKADIPTSKDTDSEAGLVSNSAKVYRRSQSEKLKEKCPKRMQQKLRRSETEKKHMENKYPQDKLSNEEFQRTIEAFIAKQMRFLREESLPIVIQNQS